LLFKEEDLYVFKVYPSDVEKANINNNYWPQNWQNNDVPLDVRTYVMIGSRGGDTERVWCDHYGKGDFEKAGGVKAILLKYAPAPAKPLLQKPDCKISYKPYNWGLNDQGAHGRNWKQTVFDFF